MCLLIRCHQLLPYFSTLLIRAFLSLQVNTTMLPTPDLSHLTKKDYEEVYEPAGTLIQSSPLKFTQLRPIEDTFLFLDALEEDAESLKALQPSICLEIGYGISFLIQRIYLSAMKVRIGLRN